jgi:hypothetical protein
MELDAEVIEPGVIRLDTDNVASVVLSPPRALRGTSETLRVVWNGSEQTVRPGTDGRAMVTASDMTAAPLQKRAGLEGQLSNFITTPFLIVVGTASDDARMRRLCRTKAETFAALWRSWQHVEPRVMEDRGVTALEEQRYSLLLIGGSDANLVSRRLMPRLPVNVESDAVTIDGRRIAATDAVLQLIYPSPSANPAQPDRYVLLVASTSTEGMYFWNPLSWNPVAGFPTLSLDWTIRDGRRITRPNGLGAERGWVASGVFDRNWRRDDRWVFPGDAQLRAASPLRHAPKPGFTPPASTLDAYAGHYQMFGLPARLVHDGEKLVIDVQGLPVSDLVAESAEEFAFGASGASLLFQRDAAGAVTGFLMNDEGFILPFTRVK